MVSDILDHPVLLRSVNVCYVQSVLSRPITFLISAVTAVADF